jgi:hypothetical protein
MPLPGIMLMRELRFTSDSKLTGWSLIIFDSWKVSARTSPVFIPNRPTRTIPALIHVIDLVLIEVPPEKSSPRNITELVDIDQLSRV